LNPAAPLLTGFFNGSTILKSIGIQCALCHSRVDDSFTAPGIPAGNVLDVGGDIRKGAGPPRPASPSDQEQLFWAMSQWWRANIGTLGARAQA